MTYTGDVEIIGCVFAINGRIIVAGDAAGKVYIIHLENNN